MFTKNKKIIDERQELQSLKNTKLCFDIIVLLLGFSVVLQATIFTAKPMHYIPECILLVIICIVNLSLEIRQGNLYTSELQNSKKNIILYFSTSLAVSLIVCVGNYIKYDFSVIMLIPCTLIMFFSLLGLMFLADRLFMKSAHKRMVKLELADDSQDTDENL